MQATTFIALNIIDAYLTKMTLAIGAAEANPLMTAFGGNIIVKGLMAIALVFILYYFEKEKVLGVLNFTFFGIALWNLSVYGMLTAPKPIIL